MRSIIINRTSCLLFSCMLFWFFCSVGLAVGLSIAYVDADADADKDDAGWFLASSGTCESFVATANPHNAISFLFTPASTMIFRDSPYHESHVIRHSASDFSDPEWDNKNIAITVAGQVFVFEIDMHTHVNNQVHYTGKTSNATVGQFSTSGSKDCSIFVDTAPQPTWCFNLFKYSWEHCQASPSPPPPPPPSPPPPLHI